MINLYVLLQCEAARKVWLPQSCNNHVNIKGSDMRGIAIPTVLSMLVSCNAGAARKQQVDTGSFYLPSDFKHIPPSNHILLDIIKFKPPFVAPPTIIFSPGEQVTLGNCGSIKFGVEPGSLSNAAFTPYREYAPGAKQATAKQCQRYSRLQVNWIAAGAVDDANTPSVVLSQDRPTQDYCDIPDLTSGQCAHGLYFAIENKCPAPLIATSTSCQLDNFEHSAVLISNAAGNDNDGRGKPPDQATGFCAWNLTNPDLTHLPNGSITIFCTAR